MTDTSKREELIRALAADVHDEYGWLSDAQRARLEWDESNRVVHFCGEGSIDVGHVVAMAEDVFEQAHTPTADETRAEVERVQKAAWAEVHGQDPMRKYSVGEVKRLVYSFDNVLGSLLARRTVQGEPANATEPDVALHSPDEMQHNVQGEPTDAQAWAAARAVTELRKRETGAPGWFNVDHARAALRAAFQEGENRG